MTVKMHEPSRPENFMSKKLIFFCLLSIGFTILLLFGTPLPPAFGTDSPDVAPSSDVIQGRNAITTFLGLHSAGKDQYNDLDAEYIGIRTLVYQLLHAPSTRLHNTIPVIVLVDQHVRQSKRQRLREDGAIVVEVEAISDNHWGDMANKLRIFDPTIVPYEKVLFIDANTVLTRPVDKIFDDPGSSPVMVDHASQESLGEANQLPEHFVMAGSPVMEGVSDSDEASIAFCSGLFLYSPSPLMFNYYQSLLGHSEPSQPVGNQGEDLLNYAHRREGPVPWQSLRGSWYLHQPEDRDLKGKYSSMHVKWQAGNGEVLYSNNGVGRYAQARRWEMEGYWVGKSAAFM